MSDEEYEDRPITAQSTLDQLRTSLKQAVESLEPATVAALEARMNPHQFSPEEIQARGRALKLLQSDIDHLQAEVQRRQQKQREDALRAELEASATKRAADAAHAAKQAARYSLAAAVLCLLVTATGIYVQVAGGAERARLQTEVKSALTRPVQVELPTLPAVAAPCPATTAASATEAEKGEEEPGRKLSRKQRLRASRY